MELRARAGRPNGRCAALNARMWTWSTSIPSGPDEGRAVRERFQQPFESLFDVRRLRDPGREPFESRRRFTLALGQLRWRPTVWLSFDVLVAPRATSVIGRRCAIAFDRGDRRRSFALRSGRCGGGACRAPARWPQD